MRVFVTGASGWIGSRVVADLLAHGHSVTGLARSADRATTAWELSTIGDPLADFSYFLMQWVRPAEGRSGLEGLDLPALGIPTLDEAAALYCDATERKGLPELDWYFAYNLFRMHAIVEGIAGRVRDGTAASAHASEMIARGPEMAAAAWRYAQRASV